MVMINKITENLKAKWNIFKAAFKQPNKEAEWKNDYEKFQKGMEQEKEDGETRREGPNRS